MHSVLVSADWPNQLIRMPPNSTVEIHCKLAKNEDPFWSINLGEDPIDSAFQFGTRHTVLNAYGVFELPKTPDIPPTLRMLVNDTNINNQTIIACVGLSESRRIVLFLQGRCTYKKVSL